LIEFFLGLDKIKENDVLIHDASRFEDAAERWPSAAARDHHSS
jgi:hypothetical protein